jgi:hypothetical protein
MKKLSFLALAAVGLLFTACSSDKDETGQVVNPEGTSRGFMSVNIQLPTTPITRAPNDVYDDGTANEYRVADACLFLYEKASTDAESAAKLVSAQKLDLGDEQLDDDDDNITSEYLAVAEVLGTIDKSKDLLALVCVNYTNVISITNGTPTVAGTSLPKGSSSFADLLALTTDNDLITNGGTQNYFFMTNTVTSKVVGGEKATTDPAPTKDNLFTLAPLDKDKIYPTKAEAIAANHEAGNVFLERAVAKATMGIKSGLKVGTYDIATEHGVMWAINNTEPTSFVVRNMGTLSPDYIKYSSEAFATPYYRMVGNIKYGTTTWVDGSKDMYRTYWCIDPQYSDDATLTLGASTYVDADGTTPLYCHENTFDVAHQNYKNTTRAVVKVKLADVSAFYAVNDNLTKFADVNDAKSYLVNAFVNDARIKQFFKDHVVAGHTFNFTSADFDFTYDEPGTGDAGYVKIKTSPAGVTLKATTNLSTAITNGDLDFADVATAQYDFEHLSTLGDIISEVNSDVKVKKFVGGEMYYTARFEHFANTYYEKNNTFAEAAAKAAGDLAPWNCWETTKPASGSTSNSYPANSKTAEENYLGRYGMVRNNWYDIEIDTIDGFGEPVDPSGSVDKGDTPDDNPKAYISVKIHILSWAKRTQKWGF